jgi:hypothetical protein
MKRIPTLKQFPYNRIHSFRDCNPYTIVYVYPNVGKPFVVKGGANDCANFFENYKTPAILHLTYWHHGYHRTFYKIININVKSCYIRRIKKRGRISYHLTTDINTIKILKRVPRKWITELNDFI